MKSFLEKTGHHSVMDSQQSQEEEQEAAPGMDLKHALGNIFLLHGYFPCKLVYLS